MNINASSISMSFITSLHNHYFNVSYILLPYINPTYNNNKPIVEAADKYQLEIVKQLLQNPQVRNTLSDYVIQKLLTKFPDLII